MNAGRHTRDRLCFYPNRRGEETAFPCSIIFLLFLTFNLLFIAIKTLASFKKAFRLKSWIGNLKAYKSFIY